MGLIIRLVVFVVVLFFVVRFFRRILNEFKSLTPPDQHPPVEEKDITEKIKIIEK